MKILIAFGTLSGNTQTVAESLGSHLVTLGHDVTVKSQDEVSADEMGQYPLVILGGSTWGDGESNPSTIAFVDNLNASQATFPNSKFAIFGLGETNYANFCAVVEHLESALKAKNAVIIGERFKIDGYPDDTVLGNVNSWAEATIALA